MADIIPFPKKEVKPKLHFEDVVETALTVTAVNLYGNMYNAPLATPNVFSQPAREKFTSISSMIQSKM